MTFTMEQLGWWKQLEAYNYFMNNHACENRCHQYVRMVELLC